MLVFILNLWNQSYLNCLYLVFEEIKTSRLYRQPHVLHTKSQILFFLLSSRKRATLSSFTLFFRMTIISTVYVMYVHKTQKAVKGKRDILWWFRQSDSIGCNKKKKKKEKNRKSTTNKILSERKKFKGWKICIRVFLKEM